jgi:hypothetical protein
MKKIKNKALRKTNKEDTRIPMLFSEAPMIHPTKPPNNPHVAQK